MGAVYQEAWKKLHWIPEKKRIAIPRTDENGCAFGRLRGATLNPSRRQERNRPNQSVLFDSGR
jgi:hypothetical protein